MRAIHFGAGNIGRGFIGALLAESGFQTTFVDVNKALIDELNDKKAYTVELAGREERVEVTGVSGLHSLEEEQKVIDAIAEADLITTAVGPHVLAAIAPTLAKGLMLKTSKANVIACENAIGGSEILKGHILEQLTTEQKATLREHIGFPNAAVDRIVPDQTQEDLLTVKVEPYYEWVVETTGLKGERPSVSGITFVEDLKPYIERKLFTVNTGHAATAYLGYTHGFTMIKEAIDDDAIKEKVRGALSETGAVLIELYGFDKKQHEEYIEKIISRFANPDLLDEVTRVGRAPLRKLGKNDRLIQPASEYTRLFDKSPNYLTEVIMAALQYDVSSDEEAVELQSIIEQKGKVKALQQVAELDDHHPILQAVSNKLNPS